jgi:site-specific recombinase XerD
MATEKTNQGIIRKISADYSGISRSDFLRFEISKWIEAFVLDRRVQGMAAGTIHFYQSKLKLFTNFLDQFDRPFTMGEISPNLIRAFLLHLEETDHNPGGRNAAYRALRAFVYFWRDEVDPEGWKNPFDKVSAPKISKAPLPPVEIDEIQALIDACDSRGRTAVRDEAIILSLADTGARAQELLDIDRENVDLITGEIYIRDGKGGKPRFVFLGKKARKAVRRYLRTREDQDPALWLSERGEKLTYWGLREVIRRRADYAGIDPPSLHSFRRFFALACIRNKMDLHTLRRLMGHADLQVLQRYLDFSKRDLQEGHQAAGPVDHSSL